MGDTLLKVDWSQSQISASSFLFFLDHLEDSAQEKATDDMLESKNSNDQILK